MSDNEAQAWGRFYHELHKLAESVRQKQKALEGADTPSSAKSTAALADTRPADSTPAPGQPQTEAHR